VKYIGGLWTVFDKHFRAMHISEGFKLGLFLELGKYLNFEVI